MSKVFTSPGVSSRPLNVFEALREWHRAGMYGHRRTLLQWLGLQFYLLRTYPARRRLLAALESGGYSAAPVGVGSPLQVESLSAVMALVTFEGKDIKLK